MPQIYVSIGTNINREEHLKLALDQLHQYFGPLTCSPVYQSQAIGFEGKDFYNMVAGFETEDSIVMISKRLKDIEKMSGRDPGAPKFSDRTLDIDLLNYGADITEQPIVLPRDEITYHAFVLQPLADIAPDWIHPVTGQSIQTMWEGFDQASQQLHQIKSPISMSQYSRGPIYATN
ncbi:MAG: 2-amino-4-hydroxy-6-hydroxymethyldihydropteridine diphosphokinase [Gammaproteobacteria bacterium]|nr:2-amino-4-hydroxy-6-hydroxymethyldihydropteridine diphosphokinase [Gammaproteobacteria bacterium]